MKWSETMIARALALQFFNRKHLVVVPNCIWTGHECDLLVVTNDLRLIDVEIKISRADLRVDAKKEKWWHRQFIGYAPLVKHFTPEGRLLKATQERISNDTPRVWPPKVWKHYYAMPADIWTSELAASLPSTASGILLLRTQAHDGLLIVTCERRATPCKDADKLKPEAAIDVARLASLRMWDSYQQVDQMRRERAEAAA